jgi:hypothetical protein
MPGYQTNPLINPYIDDLKNMDFGLGFAGKEAKGFLKKFRSGNFGEYLAPEVAAGAKRKQEIEQGYGMGSAALVGGNGGEGALYQALKDRALAASDQQTGFDSINKMDRLYGTALNAGQNAINARTSNELSRSGMILNAIGQNSSVKAPSPWWGVLNAAIGAGGAIGAAAV